MTGASAVTGKAEPSSGPRLVVEGVRKEYPGADGPIAVLKGVSLALGSGESVAVVGPSGSGKSTLLNVIGSLDKPTSGSVKLDGREVTALAGAELADYRSRRVGFVFQDHHLLPQCTAAENVMLPTLAAGYADKAAWRARDLLDRMKLADRADHLPAQLSGGERQRVAVARAMVNEPALLLCDEPTGNLDRRSAENIADLFAGLCRDRNVMLIFVTHNLRLAKRFSRTLLLRDGAFEDAAGADAEA